MLTKLIKQGKTWKEISVLTGLSRSTVAYHARKLRDGKTTKHARRYDWNVIAVYSKAHTVKQCCRKFGFSMSAWARAVGRGLVVRRTTSPPLESVMTRDSAYDRGNLKRRLITLKCIPYVCEICGLKPTWNGKPLVLRLDHRNGVYNDHRKSNLRFICPNCDSQQPTYAGRNAYKNLRRDVTVA